MSKFDIWVEKYRPQTLQEYVFKDANMRETVETWVQEKKLSAHILLSGIQGSGKCIDGDEPLSLVFNKENLTPKQYDALNSSNTIRTLFKVFDADNIEYNKEKYIPVDTVFIKSVDTYVPIRALVKKKAWVAKYVFDKTSVVCSTEHLVFENGVLKKIKDCKNVDFTDGSKPIISVEHLGEREVYDVALDAPHIYVLPNGMINHNTSLAKLLLNLFEVDPADVLEINASTENGIDSIRTKILNFCSTWAVGDMRYVLLDECLSEHEEIQLVDGNTIKLADMQRGVKYDVVSLNMETGELENDTAIVISDKTDDIYQVELEDGRTIETTLDHPFLVRDNAGKIIEKKLCDLKEGDSIVALTENKAITMITIKKITKVRTGRVINLTVDKNHTFITKNGIVTHNCDSLSPEAQRGLRNVLETYANNARFMFTCNYANKVIPALKSRVQEFVFKTLDQDEYITRLVQILDNENIQFDPELLFEYYNLTYPDMRKCINMLQQNSKTGVLKPAQDSSGNSDFMLSMADLFKQGKYTEARKQIVAQIQKEEYDNLFRYMYDHLELWGDTVDQQEQAILYIAEGLKAHALVSDPEINLAATLVQLARIRQE